MRFSQLLFCLAAISSTGTGYSSPGSDRRDAKSWSVPPSFTPNSGLLPPVVKYIANGYAYSLELTDTGIVMKFPEGEPVRMVLPHATLHGLDRLPGAWPVDVARFARVRYASPFPGINLDVYWKEGELEYDLIVEPGADPSVIRFSFSGAGSIQLDSNGDVVIETSAGYARHRCPRIYQKMDDARREIAGGFRLDANGAVAFWIGEYDHSKTLVIDPQLVWAARFGSYSRFDMLTLHIVFADSASGIAVDRAGDTYVTASCGSSPCVFVTKIDRDGKTIIYSSNIAATMTPLPCLEAN